ncbi:MAG TPA: hypothetical protein ENJ53_03270 [Phaeodactylibacter sp.]|nr:hypothetical protein [Phaeodactylibacter sp.]
MSVNGYVKYLPSVSFTNAEDLLTNNLIHNRINVQAFFGENWTAKVAFRNRLIYGELVKLTPNYSKLISEDNGELDLSFLLVDKKTLLLHSIIDRIYLDFAKNKWQVRLGRQRINWGINLAWNTNDLFNAYNIVDFDYEEKSGTDALRVQYYAEKSTSELAYKIGKDLDHSIIAALYKFNKWKYDFQFLAANYNEDIALGTGWAGNIKNAGFKGEATFFQNKNSSDKVFSLSTSVDYFFKKGLYLNVSVLFTSNGSNTFDASILNFTSSTLSAKRLMPTKFSYLVQLSNQFNPRIQASWTTIYGQGMNILFIMPAVTYSIADNWDLNLTGQLFFAEVSSFDNLNNSIFLRLQYSF